MRVRLRVVEDLTGRHRENEVINLRARAGPLDVSSFVMNSERATSAPANAHAQYHTHSGLYANSLFPAAVKSYRRRLTPLIRVV